jgi:hypothetical protein
MNKCRVVPSVEVCPLYGRESPEVLTNACDTPHGSIKNVTIYKVDHVGDSR